MLKEKVSSSIVATSTSSSELFYSLYLHYVRIHMTSAHAKKTLGEVTS